MTSSRKGALPLALGALLATAAVAHGRGAIDMAAAPELRPLAEVAGTSSGSAEAVDAPQAEPPPSTDPVKEPSVPAGEPQPPPTRSKPAIAWRTSLALGKPWAGRLERGVLLPAEGADFFTWDGVLFESPNRAWRRYGTDTLVRTLLRVVADHRRAHPSAPRVAIGDLSRPRGGNFGRAFGGLGHRSHQNGLDADIYYPRLDREESEPYDPSQIDRRLAQDLVDRLVRAGAQMVFVGPSTGLRGPRTIVRPLAYHDDHLHVRIYNPRLLALQRRQAPPLMPIGPLTASGERTSAGPR